jgi:hypothetical protein
MWSTCTGKTDDLNCMLTSLWNVVLLLRIFRRVPHPSDTLCPFTSQGALCPSEIFFLIF